jgi:hypothetical protein
MRPSSLWFAVVLASLAACSGGNVAIGTESSEANDAGSHRGSDSGLHLGGDSASNPDGIATPQLEGGGKLDGPPPPPAACPSTKPPAGSSCTPVGKECEFGSSASAACNVIESCSASGWTTEPAATPCVHATCPATYPSAMVGEACSPKDLDCDYPEGTCTCALPIGPLMADGGDTVRWQCFPKQTGCPSPRPKIGSPCASPGTSCNYGACASGVELKCEGGIWTEVMVACPS